MYNCNIRLATPLRPPTQHRLRPQVPFRGSKLTQILRDSFTARDSHTVMITHVAPANRSCDYSLNSLRYAERLKVKRGVGLSRVYSNALSVCFPSAHCWS